VGILRVGGYIKGRWIYSGSVDILRVGGYIQGRWIYLGSVGSPETNRFGGGIFTTPWNI
jgi:hypothetical protein